MSNKTFGARPYEPRHGQLTKNVEVPAPRHSTGWHCRTRDDLGGGLEEIIILPEATSEDDDDDI